MAILSEKQKLREYIKNKYKKRNEPKQYVSSNTNIDESTDVIMGSIQKNRANSDFPSNIRARYLAFKKDSIATLRENLIKESLFKIFCEAYPMDESFKIEKRNALLKAFNKMYEDTKATLIAECGSPESYAQENPNTFYSRLWITSNATAQDQYDIDVYNKTGCEPARIACDIKSMNYLLNERPFIAECKKELDNSLSNEMDMLNKNDEEEISDVINKKVVDSVVKEKEKAQEQIDKDKEDNAEIESIEQQDDANEEEVNTPGNEAPSEGEDNLEDTDDSDYDQSAGNVEDETEEIDQETKKDQDDEVKQESYNSFNKRLGLKKIRKNRFNTPSLFKTIHMNVMKNYILENQSVTPVNKPSLTVNADSVFAEAIAYYTLLETFNTVGFIPSNVSDDKKRSYIKELIATL